MKINSTNSCLSLNRIYKGDSRVLASRLEDRSIAVTLTSPPYWGLKDYGVAKQIGRHQSYQEYMEDLVTIFQHIFRATRDTGTLWIVLDTLKHEGKLRLLPFELTNRLQTQVGWLLQDVVIWDKGKTLL